MATVYEINKGINKSIEFKGIKAQYITYMAVGLVALLVLFGILHVMGLNLYISLAIVLICGVILTVTIQRFSNTYGENGLAKKLASMKLPKELISRSRKVFIQLNPSQHAEK
jgi:purine-cytosine permease-like protein